MSGDANFREMLVTAALAILETEGVEPSFRAVARSAGISAMTPYRSFRSKAALLSAVAEHGFELLARELTAVDDHPDPREALIAQGIAFVAFAQAHPALFRLMYNLDYGSAASGAVMASYHVLSDRVASVIPHQAQAATLACRSLAQGLATIALNGRLGPAPPDQIAAAFRLLVDGFSTSRPHPADS